MAKRVKQLEFLNPNLRGLSLEAIRLLDEHRKVFHGDGSAECVIDRSLRRTVLRGVK
jgi:hypothetical protein